MLKVSAWIFPLPVNHKPNTDPLFQSDSVARYCTIRTSLPKNLDEVAFSSNLCIY